MGIFRPNKNRFFFGFPRVRTASLGFPGLPGIDFTIKKLILTKKIRNTGISSETTIPGISSETAAPCYHVVTDFPFYGIF